MSDAAASFRKLHAAVKRWAAARAALRRVVDSKRASPADVKNAQRAAMRAADALEKCFREFEKSVYSSALSGAPRKKIDWGRVAGVVANFAGGIEKAVSKDTSFARAEVIDTDGHTVR